MTITNTLRKQVDLPIFEWCRFAPVASAGATTMCAPDNLTGRYLYYNLAAGANFWRYDTYADAWEQIASPTVAPAAPATMVCNANHGYYGRVISATNSTVTIAGIYGNILAGTVYGSGNTIRILSGTGAGQDRTISSVAEIGRAHV